MESAMGTIIMAVAVFDIHIDKKEVASIKPNNIRPGLIPNKIRILRAILRCKFQRSMANAIKKPPINKKMRWLKYMAETVFPSTTPNSGKRATGISAVAASGMASVIHQTAIKRAMAKV
jgi:hypothetical protein